MLISRWTRTSGGLSILVLVVVNTLYINRYVFCALRPDVPHKADYPLTTAFIGNLRNAMAYGIGFWR